MNRWLICYTYDMYRALHKTAEYIFFSCTWNPKIDHILNNYSIVNKNQTLEIYICSLSIVLKIGDKKIENSHLFRNQEIRFQIIQRLKNKVEGKFRNIFT